MTVNATGFSAAPETLVCRDCLVVQVVAPEPVSRPPNSLLPGKITGSAFESCSDPGEHSAVFQRDGRQIPCAAEQGEKTQKQGTATGRTGSGMKIGEWWN